MKKSLLFAFAFVSALFCKAQTYAPVSLSGFNEDVVANGAGSALVSTTNDVDGVQFTFMAQNFVNPSSQSPTSALPNSGNINSAATSGLQFQLAPYTGMNVLRISGTGTGTLTFSTPRAADQVYVLATSGSGTSATTITVNFTDATSQTFTQTVTDWYGGTNYAIQGISRVNRTNNVIENSATNPRLYQFLLNFSAANAGKTVQSVTFNKTTTGGVLNVMGITIRSVASTLTNDLGITAITAPNSGCSLTSQETVTVTVTNFGSAAKSNVPVSYKLNGGQAITEVFPGSLAANSTATFSFATKANLSATGTYTLTAYTPADMNTANDSFTKTITVTAPPAAPTITTNGPTTFCPGDFTMLSASTTSSGVTYQWLLNGSNINGATSAMYAATSGGNYTVVANAAGCSSAPSAVTAVTQSQAPATPFLSPNGSVVVCSGTAQVLSAQTITPGATFSWLRNGSTIAGATGATYNATQAGSYTVMAVSGGCISSASGVTTISMQQTPAKPAITQNGMVLTSSSGVGNEWFLNGTSISGSYRQNHTVTANGKYQVVVTLNNCSSDTSNAIMILNTGITANRQTLDISVYPNPGNGLFHLDLPAGGTYEITVSDLTGRALRKETTKQSNNQLDLREYAEGIYLMQLVSEKGTATRKLVVE